MYITTAVKCNTKMKQITTLFAVLRRCLYSIDQKLLLEFLLIYAYTWILFYEVRATIGYLVMSLAVSSAVNGMFVNTRYIFDYFKAN